MTGASLGQQDATYYARLDWLRWVLSSIVALGHFGVPMNVYLGNFAVQVFFVLSGFLIGGILIRSVSLRSGQFYFNRATRIWIPYLLAVVVFYGLAFVTHRVGVDPLKFLAFDLTFTHYLFIEKVPDVIRGMPLDGTGAHFWSLSIEELFYLGAPLAIHLLPFGRTSWAWLVITVLALLIDPYFGCVALGVLYATLGRHAVRGLKLLPLAVAATFLAVQSDDLYRWIAALAAGLWVMSLAGEGRPTTAGRLLGGVSYSLYLNHWIGGFAGNALAKMVILPDAIRIAVCYAIAFAIAAGLYVFLERPMLRYRSRYFTPALGRSLAAVAYGLSGTGLLLGWFIG